MHAAQHRRSPSPSLALALALAQALALALALALTLTLPLTLKAPKHGGASRHAGGEGGGYLPISPVYLPDISLISPCISQVICGLSLPMTEYKVDHDQDGSPELLWGVALTFCGTFFYALEYTLCEG